jgi:hypothetical protein
MKAYKFLKEGGEWFIDLPAYLEQGGSKRDLQMVEGADTMLDRIAVNKSEVVLNIERTSFPGADRLQLTERCDPIVGGGYYFLESFEGNPIGSTMWLCAVTEFVFSELPDQIFIKKVNG